MLAADRIQFPVPSGCAIMALAMCVLEHLKLVYRFRKEWRAYEENQAMIRQDTSARDFQIGEWNDRTEKYNRYFDAPTGKDRVIIKDGATVEDTIAFMKKSVPRNAYQAKRIANFLQTNGIKSTCMNIWHFVYNHIQYKKDKKNDENI